MKTHPDVSYMQCCIELAENGRKWVSPNPLVGCVIVKNGTVVGEGYHRRYGGAHAEINALRKAGHKARGATLYVNLEPCAHHGKTPPCVDAIISAGVKSVIVATKDPNPWVAGGGIRRLRRAGVNVRVGILKEAAERLNEKFFTFMKTGLPFVGVKIAQTLDGKIADVSGTSKWVTGEQARQYAHGLRAEYDAVLIGASTVARDNPQLTVRHAHGRNPVRIVLDGKLSAPVSARVFRASVARTLLFTSTRAMRERQRNVRLLSKQGVEVVAASNSYSLDLSSVLSILARLNISSVLIEGGSETLRAFLDSKLVHYVHCFVAPKVLGGGLNGWKLTTPLLLAKSIDVANMRVTAVGRDILIEGRLKYV